MKLERYNSVDLATQYEAWTAAEHPGAVSWGEEWIARALGEPLVAPGTTVVVGARPNIGKGYFTMQLLRGFAASGRVAYLSLEDAQLETGRRMAAGLSHPNLDVYFPDSRDTLDAFETLVRESGPTRPLVVGVDYIQCLGFDAERLTNAMNGLRELTRGYGVVSVVASQVNRPMAGDAEAGIPPTYRLKGAGAIEERADIIFMLGRGKERTLLVELAKAKNAPVGARARYRRGVGGRLELLRTSLDDDDT